MPLNNHLVIEWAVQAIRKQFNKDYLSLMPINFV